jgi:AraC-like DNA-binding protein
LYQPLYHDVRALASSVGVGKLSAGQRLHVDKAVRVGIGGEIGARIGSGALTRDSVCRALGVDARTLAHRLEAFGVTFSGLADEVRFDAAQGLLLKDRRIAEIAADLSFAEPSAFIRAFKSWSRTTPARWRATRNGAAPSGGRLRSR